MRTPKKPPPDTVANVWGRIRQLRRLAKQNASVDARDGADRDRALAKHMRAIEPALKKLQRRLEKARKTEGSSPSVKSSKTSSRRRKGPKSAKKAKTSKGSSDGDDDLLSKLDSL